MSALQLHSKSLFTPAPQCYNSCASMSLVVMARLEMHPDLINPWAPSRSTTGLHSRPGAPTAGLARAWNQAGFGREAPRSTPRVLADHRALLKSTSLWQQAGARRGPRLDRGAGPSRPPDSTKAGPAVAPGRRLPRPSAGSRCGS